MVDVVFADVAQPDQARIVALNASYFLKVGGHFIISIKASCIDSTAAPEAVFAAEVRIFLVQTFFCRVGTVSSQHVTIATRFGCRAYVTSIAIPPTPKPCALFFVNFLHTIVYEILVQLSHSYCDVIVSYNRYRRCCDAIPYVR